MMSILHDSGDEYSSKGSDLSEDSGYYSEEIPTEQQDLVVVDNMSDCRSGVPVYFSLTMISVLFEFDLLTTGRVFQFS